MTKYFITTNPNGTVSGRYIDPGSSIPVNAVEISESDFHASINPPEGQRYVLVNGQLVAQPIVVPLSEVMDGALYIVAQQFDAALSVGFTTSLGIKMDSNLESLQKLKTIFDVSAIIGDTVMDVVDYDNIKHVNVSLFDVQTLLSETGTNYRNLFMRKQQLREQITAATDIPSIEAILNDILLNGFLPASIAPAIIPSSDEDYISIGKQKLESIYAQYVAANAFLLNRYDAKYRQASAYKAAGYPVPVPDEYKTYLTEEAAIAGINERELANQVIVDYILLHSVGSKAEALRTKMKKLIPLAADAAAKKSTITQIADELKAFISSIGVSTIN
jgi:hypothetical protein